MTILHFDRNVPRSVWRFFAPLAVATVVTLIVMGNSAPRAADSPSAPASNAGSAQSTAGGAASGQPTVTRLREGTKLIDQTGFFKLTGDGLTFTTSDSTRRFGGLENLSLERVARVVSENPAQLEWTVSGTVTEYHGANYLLVTQAVLKGRVRETRTAP